MIAWTYDPLIRRNAYFNLVKLGARPTEYLRNFYGVMDDAINIGTETDRVLVRWDLLSPLAAEASAASRAGVARGERARGAVVALSGSDGRPVSGRPAAVGPGRTVPGRRPRRHRGDAPGRPARSRRRGGAALRDVLAPLMAGGARVTGFDRSGWYVVSTEGTEDEADRG